MGGSESKAIEQAQEIAKQDKLLGCLDFSNIYEQQKEYAKAQNELQAAIDFFPDSLAVYSALVSFHQRRKNLGAAENLLKVLLKKFPSRQAEIYFQQGMLKQGQKKWAEAIQLFEQSVSSDSTFWNAHYQLGRTGALSGEFLGKAEAAMQKYIRAQPAGDSYPGIEWAYYRLGQVLQFANKLPQARAAFEQTLKIDPNHKLAKEALKKL